MKIAAIVNPTSGGGRGAKYGKMTEESGRGIDVFYTDLSADPPIKASDLAGKAFRAGYQLVIAVGGDGTVSEIAGVLAGTGIPLAVIAAGTGNDFSRGLGIPQKFGKALETALTGRRVAIDLGSINGRTFVNAASFGLDAKVLSRIPQLKNRSPLSGKRLYLIALCREMFSPIEYPKIWLRFPGSEMTTGQQTTVLVAANGPQYGAMFKIAPGASFTDGRLDVRWISRISKVKIVFNLPKLVLGTDLDIPEMSQFLVRSFSVHSETELFCQVDGEVFESKKEYYISCRPSSLEVVLPQKGLICQPVRMERAKQRLQFI
jgi:diacylglycerol kinase (ATP)